MNSHELLCCSVNYVDRVITAEQGKRLADSWNALFVESSAKQNEVSQILKHSFMDFHYAYLV